MSFKARSLLSTRQLVDYLRFAEHLDFWALKLLNNGRAGGTARTYLYGALSADIADIAVNGIRRINARHWEIDRLVLVSQRHCAFGFPSANYAKLLSALFNYFKRKLFEARIIFSRFIRVLINNKIWKLI